MSLFGSIQIANNALFAAQTGLQVTGNNIANANTPGYLRQRAVMTPAPTQQVGNLPMGLGVNVTAIMQQTDRFLVERLRGAVGDLTNSETQEQAFLQLEGLIGELGESDLSTSLTNFFAAINDVLNQPEDRGVRNFAVLRGEALTQDIRRLSSRVQELHRQFDNQIGGSADEINRLLNETAELNVKIIVTEAGTTAGSDAVGLRDQRNVVLEELAQLVGIRTAEQSDGSVTVFLGGDYLVSGGEVRPVIASSDVQWEGSTSILLEDTDAPLQVSAGKLAGLYAARDEIFGGYLRELDSLSHTLAFEFNKLHSGGQGLVGYSELTSEFAVEDASAALDQAGLEFTPTNGSFQLLVRNTRTGLTKTWDAFVELDGLESDTTLADLAASLDAAEGIRAEVTADRKLSISGESSEVEFAFAGDTSGVLAALGLNTFFEGSSATDLGVSQYLRDEPARFAASRGGIGMDGENAAAMADFANQPLESRNGDSLIEAYERMTSELAQASSATQALTEGFRVFHHTLEGQHLAISGVSIDDEAVKMIAYQRAYQASARFIATISELLNVLVNL
jgi:flagellar hook-associated protein 1 FlgK